MRKNGNKIPFSCNRRTSQSQLECVTQMSNKHQFLGKSSRQSAWIAYVKLELTGLIRSQFKECGRYGAMVKDDFRILVEKKKGKKKGKKKEKEGKNELVCFSSVLAQHSGRKHTEKSKPTNCDSIRTYSHGVRGKTAEAKKILLAHHEKLSMRTAIYDRHRDFGWGSRETWSNFESSNVWKQVKMVIYHSNKHMKKIEKKKKKIEKTNWKKLKKLKKLKKIEKNEKEAIF